MTPLVKRSPGAGLDVATSEPATPVAEQVVAELAGLLLANGQTTEGTRLTIEQTSRAVGQPVHFTARWGEFALRHEGNLSGARYLVQPTGVDIGRVMATEHLADQIIRDQGKHPPLHALQAIHRSPPVALARFAPMAAAGAASLGVIFGAPNLLTLVLIALVAGAGACVRRGLSHISDNPFLQPLAASFLAGIVGGGAMSLNLDISHRLLMVCPCMILVPGPHFLNGTIDLARARIPLGSARVAFAGLIVVAICAGLLTGCACLGWSLPLADTQAPVPLASDVAAAGVAVAAYGTFFNMPWRILLLPAAIGMLAHALRWEMLQAGTTLTMATFGACLLVSLLVTPLARRFHIPFGAFAFAAIVSMIPGVFMFECAADTLSLINGRTRLSAGAIAGIFQSGATACVILFAMTFGLIGPKMTIDALIGGRRHATSTTRRE